MTLKNQTTRKPLRRLALALIVCSVIAIVSGCGASSGKKADARTRVPSEVELQDLTNALSGINGSSVTVSTAVISRSSAAYALATCPECGNGVGYTRFILHRTEPSWAQSATVSEDKTVVYDFNRGETLVGACAYVPEQVMRDFFGLRCPSKRNLVARRAGRKLIEAFTRIYLNAVGVSKIEAERLRLSPVCISRRDPRWAGAQVIAGTPGPVVFFHKERSSWRLVSEDESRPSSAIRLSLAFCVGYRS
jgi:hypothetical protein